ncbi:hypothetical protein LV89_01995 [Arcicella aurantiaca]|uniref:Uncharacterized protein n=1 Tax=Arcicella aurantiaca TaxID=591202 RepID=A0A316E9K8_9BACT|nr:hypothetical protein [Arcicella aurantiaca]PWK27180.1 hypothetical protein LV89_01995 [Arcicella aurantiaca]
MSNNTTTAQNGKATSMPTQLATTPKANTKIISLDTEEIKALPTVSQVFERIQQGISLQAFHAKSSVRYKEIFDGLQEGKEGTGFILKAFFPSGRILEFPHLISNLEFLENQERKGKEHLNELEGEIQSFTIS